MHYFQVAVASSKYHGKEVLTYASDTKLADGSIIEVPLQRSKVLGFVVAETTKPSFAVKEILASYDTLPPLPAASLGLHSWIRTYYPASLGITTQLFLPKSLPLSVVEKIDTLATEKSDPVPAPSLSTEQKAVLDGLSEPGSYLLYGETGSGKTRVYIEAARRVMEAGRSALILTPEISLTSQLITELGQTFPNESLVLIHSQQTIAERRKLWLQLLTTESPKVVVGPRSALFSPIRNVGLIVVDEAHEVAYKQENTPHYHATRVASKLTELHKAQLILGSATPSVTDYFVAEQKQRPILRMQERAQKAQVSDDLITTIDLRDRNLMTRDSYLSDPLLAHIEQALAAKQQSLLFINRRGTARIVLCENCGWQALCPHCDLPLTYHQDSHSLRCHTCNFAMVAPPSCPECGNADITLRSVGTKLIAATIQKLFPAARMQRFDTDNKKGERINDIYQDVRSGEVDILVGTQVLAKGLDLPKLGVVGVVNADSSLYIPDFTAQERTYQLLHQIIGRVGRGHQQRTTALIQTYSPDNLTLQAAVNRDWQLFYETELAERRQYVFPPFCYLMKLSCRRVRAASALENAEKFATTLRQAGLPILVEGPAPAFHEKVQNKYVWQVIIKAKQRDALLQVISLLPADWSYDIDPINLL